LVVLISAFDPWRSPHCTCPPKMTLNPYTGCDHDCVYCYVSGYVPRFFECRPKKDLLGRLRVEAPKLRGELLSMSNSSDPYPNMEAEKGLTRDCLKILAGCDCKVQIVTKSDLVARDADLLADMPGMVSVTITTDDDALAKLIEPNAPSPADRIRAVEKLIRKGVPTSVRVDPLFPFVNSDVQRLLELLASIGVKHVTSSTYKAKPDNWRRLAASMPEVAERLRPLYFELGEKVGNSFRLPRDLRLELMESVAASAKRFGMKFGTCREGLSHLNTAVCDGSWLLPRSHVVE